MVRSGWGGGSLGTAVEYRVKTWALLDVLRLGFGGSRGQGALSGCSLQGVHCMPEDLGLPMAEICPQRAPR